MQGSLPPVPPGPIVIDPEEEPGPEPDPSPPPHNKPVSTRASDRTEGAIAPSSFYVPAPHSKDSERISIRVHADILGAATKLVDSGVFDWDSFSDFVRWSLFRGVQEAAVHLRDECFSNEVKVMAAIQKQIQSRRREEMFAGTLAQVRSSIQDLLRQDAKGDALILFKEAVSDAEAMTISRYKLKFIADLKAAFPDLAQMAEEDSRG